jgi:hypothetical protein
MPGAWEVRNELPGWSLVSGPGIELQQGVAGAPSEGRQHIELDSHGSSAIGQQVTTEAGIRYRLRLSFRGREGTLPTDNVIRVSWNGTQAAVWGPVDPSLPWKSYETTIEGRAGTSQLEIFDLGVSNSSGSYLDDVSLQRLCP